MGLQIGGEFIGFSFDGVHSSELGIIRTSDGSRYNYNLLPSFQDKTSQVQGQNGTLYFGTQLTQRPFDINIAYDSLTEEQFQRLKKVFYTNSPKKLVFDEAPDRHYWAKIASTPNLKFICFDKEEETSWYNNSQYNRIYKGEGTLKFVCYDPYGYSENKEILLNITDSNKHNVTIPNLGDVDSDWKLIFSSLGHANNKLSVRVVNEDNPHSEIKITDLVLKEGDSKIVVDSKTNLIFGATEEYGELLLTSNIYNEFFKGNFFKIQSSNVLEKQTIMLQSKSNTKIEKIIYNYKYI